MIHPAAINTTIFFVSLIHGLIDLTSALVIYNCAIVHNLPPQTAVTYTIFYDLMAFALQPLAGIVIDSIKRYRLAAIAGVVLVLAGALFMRTSALTAVLFVGIGNAFFHLGIGAQILTSYPDSASRIGIFTGPGAVGLSMGIWYGTHGFFPIWFLSQSLFIAAAALVILPKFTPENKCGTVSHTPILRLIILLVLTAIAIRGSVGHSGFSGLQNDAFTIIGLGIAACAGKISGGIISDKYGWKMTTLTALLLSGISILFIHCHICFAFLAMLLFQMPMAVTLTVTSGTLPGKPALSFGLTCLALFCGTFISYNAPPWLSILPVTLLLITIAGGCIIYSLYLFDKSVKHYKGTQTDVGLC
ncbi:MAG TPA: hypothetical protein VHO70_02390 [Chitinispirillaceae bacterium]|nr:hypothetical protein [Chitinispirillaceae bacterium]